MPNDAVFSALNALHRGVLRLSGGRLGGRLKGMPVVQLTATGRRSGEPRSVMLTSPLQPVDGTYVVVGSRGGDDRHPDWFLNVRERAEVVVAVGGERRPMRARVLEGAERADVWRQVTSRYPHYAGYQRKTDREIPLVVLEPA